MKYDSSVFLTNASPAPGQIEAMKILNKAAKDYADVILELLEDGADRDYIIRRIREIAMWCNVCVLKHDDGADRV